MENNNLNNYEESYEEAIVAEDAAFEATPMSTKKIIVRGLIEFSRSSIVWYVAGALDLLFVLWFFKLIRG